MMVKKKNGKWLLCVDFTDLNKAFPKDPFPIPRIDQLVDATVGYHRMRFLYAFWFEKRKVDLSKDDDENV